MIRPESSAGKPGSAARKVRTKTVGLSQTKRVPVYYEHDEEARAIASNLFTVLDADKNGFLNQDELAQAQSKMLALDDTCLSHANLQHGVLSTGRLVRLGLVGLLLLWLLKSSELLLQWMVLVGKCRVDDEEWHQFFRSLYELLGRKQFLSLANKWVSNMGAPGIADNGVQKPKLQHAKTSAAVLQGAAVTEKQDSLPELGRAHTNEDCGPEAGGPPMDADANAAALKIQKSFRGKKGRKETERKRIQSQKFKKSATAGGKMAFPEDSAKAPRVEQKATTFSELWDDFMIEHGQIRTRIGVDEVVDMFIRCKETGLNQELVKIVPMHFEEPYEAEVVSSGEVAHLSMLLIAQKDLSYEDAQLELMFVKESCREIGDQRGQTDRDAELGMRLFKKLLEFLSRMMRIDLEYFITQMSWLRNRPYEMADTLAALIMERAARKEIDAGQLPELLCLEEFFTMNYLMNLAYNCNLIDPSGAHGIVGSDMQLLYKRVHTQMPELLQRHAETRKRKTLKGTRRDEHSLLGRTEIEILMEELFKEGALSKRFSSPLEMVVQLLQKED